MKPRPDVLFALLLVVPGCTTGPHGAYVPSAQSVADKAPRGKATVVIPLPPIRPKGAPIDWNANLLSSATTSATLTVGKTVVVVGPIALTQANSDCVTQTAGLTCTIVATIKPAINQTVLVQTYATAVQLPLAVGKTTTNLYSGRNTLAIQMSGIARRLKVVPAAKKLHHGQFFLDTINVKALDAANVAIPGTHTIDSGGYGFQVLLRFSGFHTKTIMLRRYRFADTLRYDGLSSGTETIEASAQSASANIPPASTTLKVLTGNTDFAPLILGVGVPKQRDGKFIQTIAQFPLNAASGSPTPVRQFKNPHSIPSASSRGFTDWAGAFGEDDNGSFWIGNVHFSNSLAVLGTVSLPSNVHFPSAVDRTGHLYGWDPNVGACALYEFSNGYGYVGAIREIDGPCGENVATDAAGNVYDAGQFFVPYQSAPVFGVQEYAANGGSGHIAPIRQMVVSTNDDLAGRGFLSLDIDDAGNVYVAAQTGATPSGAIYKFAPGYTTGTVQIGGLEVLGFAVDGAGDIYAAIPAASNPSFSQVEEFPPGATTPMRTFSGKNSYGMPILVPR